MADANRQDWVAPALLIVAALVFGLVIWGVYAATRSGEPEDASLIEQLEAYSMCLSTEGANVPVVESRRDGGFAVIVPGALLEGDIDFEQLVAARDSCRHLEPNPLELLFSGGELDPDTMSMLGPLLDRGFGRDRRGGGIEDVCERLRRGESRDFEAPEELYEVCELLGG